MKNKYILSTIVSLIVLFIVATSTSLMDKQATGLVGPINSHFSF